MKDGLSIEDITFEEFSCLGDNGFIQAAQGHACSECTHAYRRTADTISDLNVIHQSTSESEGAPVKIIVINGIVIGPTYCTFDNCTADLDNS